MNKTLNISDLGFVDYLQAWELQKDIFNKRLKNEIPDTLLLLEHPNTYTLGKTADRNNLIASDSYLNENGFSVYDIDRGGDITYHGPGQLVGYPILNLKNWKEDTHLYLRALEEVVIKTCADYGLETGRKKGLTGVWIDDRKICAMGIKVSRWITMHGFAFNVNTDLSLFNGIIPCGIKDKEVTSLEKEINANLDMNEAKEKLANNFIEVFEYSNFNKIEKREFLNIPA
ncbi:MAG: lipoyl(octanoyl) transferase LipB [Chlorobi bacterium]|nr:lipoyl(octanoyl) transferase LipB [Chlorobiota bacterium]